MWPLVSYSNDTRLARLYGLVRALLVTIVTMTIVTSILTLFVWVVLHDISGLSSDDLGSITAIIESVSAMVGALFVVFELQQSAQGEERSRMIEQQQFLFEYNKAFIEDPNMAMVESLLERYDQGELSDDELITGENRQAFVNYLVYLEGLAPLVLDGIMDLTVIDDLMAYRFYLAVNNPVVQKDQLFVWPGYYLGCFKLYQRWTEYRHERGLEILRESTSALDAWRQYPSWLELAGKAMDHD